MMIILIVIKKYVNMKIDYKLGAFVIGLLTLTAIVFFGVLSIPMGENWNPHIKALYLINYALLILIIINFLINSDKKTKRGETKKKK